MPRLFFVFLTALIISNSGWAARQEPLNPDNFDDRFETFMKSKNADFTAYKDSCGEGFARTCTYTVRTSGFVVKSRDDGKGLDWVAIICAKDCKGTDFLSIVTGVAGMLSPGLSASEHARWLSAVSRVIDAKSSETLDIGKVTMIASMNDLTGISVVVSVKESSGHR